MITRYTTATLTLAFITLLTGSAAARQLGPVDCSAGASLAEAIAAAPAGATILVTGTCAETVVIKTDDLTIEGVNGAVIDGQMSGPDAVIDTVTIDAARRVTLRNLTTQGGRHGIFVDRGASATLEGITSQDNRFDGIRADKNSIVDVSGAMLRRNGDDGLEYGAGAAGTIRDTTSQENNDDGYAATGGGSITTQGAVVSTQNGDDAITITTGSNIRIFNTDMSLNQNDDDGLSLTVNSSALMAASTFSSSDNGQDEAGGDGIQILSASAFTVLSSTMDINRNANNGIRATRNASLSITSNSTLNLLDNGNADLALFNSSAATISSSTTLTISDSPDMDVLISPESVCGTCPMI